MLFALKYLPYDAILRQSDRDATMEIKSKLKKPKQVVVSMNQMKKSLFCILFLVTSAILNTCTAEPTSPIQPENLFEEHSVSVQEDGEDISFLSPLETRNF